jgi:hypothetical protein
LGDEELLVQKQYPVPRRVTPQEVRDLAKAGSLSISLAEEARAGSDGIGRAVYEIVWPIVFSRITKAAELSRGHTGCARSVTLLDEDCLDRFHDDVAAVLDVVRRRASCRIEDLEKWIAGIARAATIDAHRRRRGELGALQRPRPPRWLCNSLNCDPWLVSLAIRVLEWVGVRDAISSGLWPLSRWSELRGQSTGDWAGSTPEVVFAEVEHVLAKMRTDERWYSDYVERPIGRKRAPTAHGADSSPLPPIRPHDVEDAQLRSKADATMREIATRTRAGENPPEVALDALRRHFCADAASAEMDKAPHHAADAQEWLTKRLNNGEEARTLASAVAVTVTAGLQPPAQTRHNRGGEDVLVAASR